MKLFAASKYFLQIRELERPVVVLPPDDHQYAYWRTRTAAVDDLIQREQDAIAHGEKELKRHRARLAKFMKKEGRV